MSSYESLVVTVDIVVLFTYVFLWALRTFYTYRCLIRHIREKQVSHRVKKLV